MKFLCIGCDEPMTLREARPDEGTIAAVFACPSCHQAVAMLTNPWETEVVQSLGVKLAAGEDSRCPFSGVVQQAGQVQGEAGALAWTAGALARLERIPEFVRPMARQGIEQWARAEGRELVTESLLDEARGRFGM